jgi:FKBP-type peptidyl-prolyl cis-trans isomerase
LFQFAIRAAIGLLAAHVFANEYLMKKPIALIALSTALTAASAQNSTTIPGAELQPEVEQFSSIELLETWGYLLSERFNLGGLEVTDAEIDAITRGMKAYVNREKPPTDLSKSITPMQNYFVEREETVRKDQLRRNKAAELEYFDGLVGRPDYQSLGSGLYFQIIEPGSDVKPGPKDMVRCHYRGTLLDGTEFDSSYARNEPSEFALNAVIQGWGQGVPLIGEGGKIKLYVPSKLGYGDQGQIGIPPASALIFEIELIKVLGPAPAGGPPLPPQQQQ